MRRKFILQNHQILGAEAHNGMHFAALLMQLLSHGEGNGAAHAAAYHGYLAEPLRVGCTPQGTHKVVNIFAFIQVIQLGSGSTDDLEDNRYAAALPVIIRHGQGDPLPILIHTQDNKLSRLSLSGDQRCVYAHKRHRRVQRLFLQNFIHRCSPFSKVSFAL